MTELLTPSSKTENYCSICGNPSCEEATDHSRITPQKLQELLNSHKVNVPYVRAMRQQAECFYNYIAERVLETLRQDKKKVLLQLSKLQFPFLVHNDKKRKFKTDLVAQVTEGIFTSLPSRALIPILQELERPREGYWYLQIQNIRETLDRMVSESSAYKICTQFQEMMVTPTLSSSIKSEILLKSKVSIRDSVETCESEEDDDFTFTLRRKTFTCNARTFELNNCQLRDFELIQPIRLLKNFTQLRSVELRHNNITELTCRMLGANLKNLEQLDLRSNKIGDEGIVIIAKTLPKLQKFYACETGASDDCVGHIVQNMQLLTFLWLEHNRLSFEGCKQILRLPRLKAIGLMGNPITQSERQIIKQSFRSGYIAV